MPCICQLLLYYSDSFHQEQAHKLKQKKAGIAQSLHVFNQVISFFQQVHIDPSCVSGSVLGLIVQM